MSNEFKLVPVEPTDEMIHVGCDSYFDCESSVWSAMAGAYKAMLAAAPQPPALGVEPEVMGYGYKDECTHSIGLAQQGDLEPLIRLSDHRTHLAPLQAEIERLNDVIAMKDREHLESSRVVTHISKERDQLKADLAERWEQIAELNSEAVQLKARCEELGCLLLGWYTANCDGQIQVEDSAYHIVTATAEALSKPAGSEQ